MSSEINKQVAQRVYGLLAKEITVEWYRLPITLFFHPAYPNEIHYSYDDNACNAMMYRNGKDDRAGTAPSLPFFSEDIHEAWNVLLKCKDVPGFREAVSRIDWLTTEEEAATAICLAALSVCP